ncbi:MULTISPECIES: hypothetical protein [Brevibacillus]|jgi:hypothetical protein|uniref:hypothetical protein n=1 Tax=Brevibacillus TaxID=55080 RepID=UPI00156B8C11|nr:MULTISPECIES: hypothetical protein [Brevibacillus]MDH6351532.1 polyhydroxyalkanoate synthesis regulator phasin [Brevibacillus sp. 1238]MDR4997395.1 hypothetical protein [Brevibacillus parabrevis]MED2255704.1 hypothetical protein [Brevibacillus parabrevis]NRQ55082.1 hypothetical protein [Brevibacillus sp. HD1.4A]UED69121.1 hypothetical protein HP435_28470 [Brevibacillus sp. HD3.3A]
MKEVQIIAKLADLQETDYHNTLVLHALIDILVAKGLLTHDELTEKVNELDSQLSFQLDTIAQLSNAISRRQTQTKPLL